MRASADEETIRHALTRTNFALYTNQKRLNTKRETYQSPGDLNIYKMHAYTGTASLLSVSNSKRVSVKRVKQYKGHVETERKLETLKVLSVKCAETQERKGGAKKTTVLRRMKADFQSRVGPEDDCSSQNDGRNCRLSQCDQFFSHEDPSYFVFKLENRSS